jgi:hypothetical protein
MVLLLHFAFERTSVALCFFRNGPPGSGYFLSFAIRMRQPFDAKKEKRERYPSFTTLLFEVCRLSSSSNVEAIELAPIDSYVVRRAVRFLTNTLSQ